MMPVGRNLLDFDDYLGSRVPNVVPGNGRAIRLSVGVENSSCEKGRISGICTVVHVLRGFVASAYPTSPIEMALPCFATTCRSSFA
jgi:hypothetical protein